jgi:hypothetical protein
VKLSVVEASTSAAFTAPQGAASSAVVAPKPRRSRKRTLTTVDRRTRVWKRIAELTALFTAALGVEATPLRRMKIEQAAQLTALAEIARGRFMRNGDGTLDDIVRLERKADGAVRALGVVESKPKPPSIADIVARHKPKGAAA